MRLFIISLLSYTFLFSQTLSIMDQQHLKTYNHRPSLKKTVDKRMTQMAKVSREEASQIAKPLCKMQEPTLKLMHEDRYLFYLASSGSCNVYINALDGSVLNRERVYD